MSKEDRFGLLGDGWASNAFFGAAAAAAGISLLDQKTGLIEDLKMLSTFSPGLLKLARGKGLGLLPMWQEAVAKHRDRVIVSYKGSRLTFGDVDKWSDGFARWFLTVAPEAANASPDNNRVVVAMKNCPMFCIAWVGLAKVGLVPAFVNTALRGDSMVHAIKEASPRAVICDDSLLFIMDLVHDKGSNGLAKLPVCLFCPETRPSGNSIGKPLCFPFTMNDVIANSTIPIPGERLAKLPVDTLAPCCYIYTSGTTGLPKAVPMTNRKFAMYSLVGPCSFSLVPEDVIFCSLPLLHTSGLFLGFGSCVLSGCSIALTEKFSASDFWRQVDATDSTIVLYIGEICRYIASHTDQLAGPARPSKLRGFMGNGVSGNSATQIWSAVQATRKHSSPLSFVEFYGSTEGNGGLVSLLDDKAMSQLHSAKAPSIPCGTFGSVMRWFMGGVLLQVNDELKVTRYDNGLCKLAEFNGKLASGSGSSCYEGELAFPINQGSRAFKGYFKNDTETESKIIRNVLVKGDGYFRTGDILRLEGNRYFFVRRAGDTIRVNGENISLQQVETLIQQSISTSHKVSECVAYPVTWQSPKDAPRPVLSLFIALDSKDSKDSMNSKDRLASVAASISEICQKSIMTAAHPKFLVFQTSKTVEDSTDQEYLTSTFKISRVALSKKTLVEALRSHTVYVLDRSGKSYSELRSEGASGPPVSRL